MKILSLEQVRHLLEYDLHTLEMLKMDVRHWSPGTLEEIVGIKIEGMKRRLEKLESFSFEIESPKEIA